VPIEDKAVVTTVGKVESELAVTPHITQSDPPIPKPTTTTTGTRDDETRKRQAQAVKAHEEEAMDRRWSARSEFAFRAALERLTTTLSCTIQQLDCKTTSCLAQMSFASAASAREALSQVARVDVPDVNCNREAWVPKGDGTVYLLLDCTDLRASQVH
jgi:hypothetical protein